MLRKATHQDAATLADFNCKMAWETEETRLDPQTVLAGVHALLDHPDWGFYLVAERDGRVVGALMVTTEWSDWHNGVYWWIQSVYVHSDFRRQGIYRQLYEFVKELGRQDGRVHSFRLYVERDNARALQTYASLGMSQTPYRIFEEVFGVSEPR